MKRSKLVRETAIFELEDHGQLKIPAVMLVRGDVPRNTQGLSARLAHQFLKQNHGILRDFEIEGNVNFDGSVVYIQLHAGGQAGALPLLSPTSGRPDYGLVIKPRFGWQGIGPMLGSMGWKVIPVPLRLPLLPRSDRKIPPWVLSTTILLRLQKLIERLDRSFEFTEEDLTAPRGQVNWTRYAITNIPRAGFMNVPCRFPDLKDDRDLKGAIHYTLRKQLSSLQSQRTAGVIVLQLLSLCQSLLEKVRDVPAIMPTQHAMNRWLQGNFSTEIFRKGMDYRGPRSGRVRRSARIAVGSTHGPVFRSLGRNGSRSIGKGHRGHLEKGQTAGDIDPFKLEPAISWFTALFTPGLDLGTGGRNHNH